MTKGLLNKIIEMEKSAGKNWLEIIRKAGSEEDLLKIANQHGISLTQQQAAEGYQLLHPETAVLSETELSQIAGGIPPNK